MAGAVDDGWTMVIGQPASEIREEKQIEEWERSKGGWSGFGKHPQNWMDHKKLHLSSEKELGSGSYGLVQRVTYGAVTMARKHVVPRGGMTVEKLREEANAMEELAHKHILKLVGTYTYKRKNLYLLLYPAATCDLSTFLDDIDGIRSDTCADRDDAMKRLLALGLKDIGKIDDLCMLRRPILPSEHPTHMKRTETALGFLQQLMGCVTEALLFVHEKGIRHRDLKPKNILLSPGRVYLADFGIARDVKDSDNSITCGRYGTASWIAPEVYDGEYHHMSSADVFSLGCIFLNIATVLYGDSMELATFDEIMKEKEWPMKYEMLSKHLNKLKDKAIRAALADEEEPNFDAKNILGLVEKMLLYEPEQRPSVKEVNERLCELGGLDQIYHLSCCHKKNDVMSRSINTKMRTISESSLSSKSRISELETENITLRERLATLQNKDQTYELRIEHERNHAKKQNDVLKERYEKQLKAQTEALIRAEERIKALESNNPHKRRPSHTRGRGRNPPHGIPHPTNTLNINNLAVHTNSSISMSPPSPSQPSNRNTSPKPNAPPRTPESYFPLPPRNPSFTNLKDPSLSLTLHRRPSGIPIPTRSPTPITTPHKPQFPPPTSNTGSRPGSGNSTLVSSTHSVFSIKSKMTDTDGSITPVESPGETMSLPGSPGCGGRGKIGIGERKKMEMDGEGLGGVLGDSRRMKIGNVGKENEKEKEKERTIKPTWARMVRGKT
ncbi:putative serine threonine protein kinase protein [Botrytis fragariae]|uniref:Putative serine threonine protein kinase protein n=1 Tax=Botrytis fragariae TaxID=1964551 RepID=A0A8H6ANK7_9HELO|nr:putative serine threonine protein kinase protein [Botrytis fragariae]KAF5870505.1 putative serine threonine protein kinase protein [Botrytis fragariae]